MVILWYLMRILIKTRCNNNNWQQQCQWLQLTIQQKGKNHDHRRKHEHEHKHEHHHKGCCVGVPRCFSSNPPQSMLHWPKQWSFAAWTNQDRQRGRYRSLAKPWVSSSITGIHPLKIYHDTSQYTDDPNDPNDPNTLGSSLLYHHDTNDPTGDIAIPGIHEDSSLKKTTPQRKSLDPKPVALYRKGPKKNARCCVTL